MRLHNTLIISILLSLVAVIMMGCTDDIQETNQKNGSYDEIGSIYNHICLKWGSSKDEVKNSMSGIEDIKTSSENMLIYKDKKQNTYLTYSFVDDKLSASELTICSNEDQKDYSFILDKYTYLADLSEFNIYHNLSGNTIAAYRQQWGANTIIGYAPVTSDLYPYMDSPGIITDDVTMVEPFTATLNATLLGNDGKNTECGFYVGFSPKFEDDTYTKVKGSSTNDLHIKIKGLYGERTYFYQSYAIIDKVEYKGDVKSFISAPISYKINNRECQFILIEGGPYGDIYMFETEIPANTPFILGGKEYCLTQENNGYFTSYHYRNIFRDLNNNSGLPVRNATTQEWQLAARGGRMSKGYIFSGSNNLDEVGWYQYNSGATPHTLMSKKCNELGLYDMSGNYSELVADGGTDYFKNHVYLTYEHFNSATKAYGGNWDSSENNCKIDSWINALPKKDCFDGTKVALRIVFNIDPTVLMY